MKSAFLLAYSVSDEAVYVNEEIQLYKYNSHSLRIDSNIIMYVYVYMLADFGQNFSCMCGKVEISKMVFLGIQTKDESLNRFSNRAKSILPNEIRKKV